MVSFFKNISIKWKLSLALIATGLGLVLIYIFLAKSVFEKDKISYVFDSQQSHLMSINREIDSRLKTTIFSSRSLLATLGSDGKISPDAQQLFDEDSSLSGIEIRNDATRQITFRLVKPGVSIPSADEALESVANGKLKLIPEPDQRFLLIFPLSRGSSLSQTARVLMDAHDILPTADVGHPTVLIQGQQMIASVGTSNVDGSIITELVRDFGHGESDLTKIWTSGKKHFLVSSGKLPIGDLKTLVLTPGK